MPRSFADFCAVVFMCFAIPAIYIFEVCNLWFVFILLENDRSYACVYTYLLKCESKYFTILKNEGNVLKTDSDF